MIIKFKPIALSKVWGGDKFSKKYQINQPKIGEIWGISAHKSHTNEILNDEFKGITFRTLFEKHRDLFGNYPEAEFPILFKLIDTSSDLSIQVHPDNLYALKHENSFGKDECWYILETKNNTRIQIGHKANTQEELMTAIEKQKIEKILTYFSIQKGDYFYIPSGKVHAIFKNTTLLEVSQSSDVTYRIYDYDRLHQGSLRKLHTYEALEVIDFPDKPLIKKH
jgi:mannose-6-phosphate isomerase